MVSYTERLRHISSHTPQNKNVQSTQPASQPMAQSHHMQPVKQPMAQSDDKKSVPVNSPTQVTTSIPKRDTKPLVKLNL